MQKLGTLRVRIIFTDLRINQISKLKKKKKPFTTTEILCYRKEVKIILKHSTEKEPRTCEDSLFELSGHTPSWASPKAV